MEDKHTCLMVGLPCAGKSTYIAAFWAIEKEGNTGHNVSCRRYPSDTTYLDELKNKWLRQELVQRTVLSTRVELDLVNIENNQELVLQIPDFKGEDFHSILMNEVNDTLFQWIKKADSILFFVPQFSMPALKDEVIAGDESRDAKSNPAFTLTSVSLLTQNIMLLKYLSDTCGMATPISICFSAWDEIDTESKSVEEWLHREYPFFYNFVTNHFCKYRFFGVSAQGKKYGEGGNDFDEELDELTEKKQRAYVFTDHKSNDITEPLSFLLEA